MICTFPQCQSGYICYKRCASPVIDLHWVVSHSPSHSSLEFLTFVWTKLSLDDGGIPSPHLCVSFNGFGKIIILSSQKDWPRWLKNRTFQILGFMWMRNFTFNKNFISFNWHLICSSKSYKSYIISKRSSIR